MSLGHQLIKEQLFFRKELRERVYWFINLRWLVVTGGFLGSWTVFFLDPRLPVFPITIIILAVLGYNILFFFIWLRLKELKHYNVKPFAVFAHTQITCDLVAFFFIIYFTGGIYSPVLIFANLHIILTGILLSPASCFIYAALVILAFGILMILQKTLFLPLQPVLFQSPIFTFSLEFPGIIFFFLTLAAFIMICAFLITTIKISLRIKVRELLKVSKELDRSNTKLKTLYEMVKDMGNLYDLQALMDAATRNGAIIMGVKGCSIKLLDEQRKKLKISSVYGLSQDYAAKAAIDIEKSPINLKIIRGHPFSIGRIDKKTSFQYPEDIQKEGIASMVCLPLKVQKIVLGVFCIYSDAPNFFKADDVAFFALMADLTAIGIENIKRELNKTWFLAKSAHQLRSPLNAIYSMLEVIQKGYQGPINPEQKETLNRCETRIKILRETINDLLKIMARRGGTKTSTLSPVDLEALLQEIASLYAPRASDKKIRFKLDMDDGIPKMRADKQLLDDLFSNLIANAIRYTPPNGDVRVVLSVKNYGLIQFQVSDTGIGIPDEDFSKIFTEFFRSENAKSFAENGTGLGLIIVKEALDILNGTISVESKTGKGTRFTCLFPILSADH